MERRRRGGCGRSDLSGAAGTVTVELHDLPGKPRDALAAIDAHDGRRSAPGRKEREDPGAAADVKHALPGHRRGVLLQGCAVGVGAVAVAEHLPVDVKVAVAVKVALVHAVVLGGEGSISSRGLLLR